MLVNDGNPTKPTNQPTELMISKKLLKQQRLTKNRGKNIVTAFLKTKESTYYFAMSPCLCLYLYGNCYLSVLETTK